MVGSDRRAADLDSALKQDHHRALGCDGLADLVADHAVKRVIWRWREGAGRAGDEQKNKK